ncbi:hypothetical protein [Planomonospora sp. ID82291]|uniref:hypothetical protein n=1 Tax=Planomonospora sp. ID82291 TaxID=2738136 RepID=UPI0018C3CA24|nr:hypothetical protein [Planomonospora sp. ID82291]MBG0818780.1 hypothetical protein [Planomonospora sp. ID82291]
MLSVTPARAGRGDARSLLGKRLFECLMELPPAERRPLLEELTADELRLVYAAAYRVAGSAYAVWLDDPVGFCDQVLGSSAWSVPRKFMHALTEHKQVAVPSCFGSSKTYSCGQIVLWHSLIHPVGTGVTVTLAPLWRQVVRQLWREVRGAHSRAGLPGTIDMAQYKLPDANGLDTVVAYGIAAAPYNEAAVQGIHCFDDQTELLTDQGWKKFPKVTGEERVLTLNGDAAEWGPITEVVRAPFDGYLNLHDGERVNFCITDNHRLLVRSRKKEYKRHSRITAEQGQEIKEQRARGVSADVLAERYGVSRSLIYMIAQGRRDHAMVDRPGGPRWRLAEYRDLPDAFVVRRTNTWGGGTNPDTVTFTQPSAQGRKAITYTFSFEDWARFLGWYVAEGHTYQAKGRNTFRVSIAQNPGRKYDEIADLLSRMGITFGRYARSLSFSHYAIAEWLREHCGVGSGDKRIPRCIKEARPEVMEAFLDSFGKGEGAQHTHADSRRYVTSSKQLADDLHEVLCKLGRGRKVRPMHAEGSQAVGPQGTPFRRHRSTWMINDPGVPVDSDVLKKNVVKHRYKGMVYCVSTPHQTIMVRRNGCAMWSGNSNHLLLVVEEAGGIAQTIGDNLAGLMVGDGARMIAIGNPPTDEQNTWFEKLCNDSDVLTIPISAYDTPNLTGERFGMCQSCPGADHSPAKHMVDETWIRRTIRVHGERSNYVRAKIKAQFPLGVANATIPADWVQAARDQDEPATGVRLCDLGLAEEVEQWKVAPGAWIRLGVDVAADGGDELVIARLVGDLATVEFTNSGPENADQVQVAHAVLQQIRRAERLREALGTHDPVRVKVDGIGVGWGVVSVLRSWKLEGLHNADVISVVVSEKTGREPDEATMRPFNKRAEMWLSGRALIQPDAYGATRLRLRVDDMTVAQLSSPKLTTTAAGGYSVVEPKPEMKKRGIHSPDRAEGLLLAPYEPLVEEEEEWRILV